ncbi:unnamed protein product [Thlaspi arvense]|uniref:RNase H type-1 domain-containing protein n=1 Tax=Thlaspi arvense TaxID=13288 RepID=A0AAU9STR7_THLAR|nr:unnamed protein product [Thlaspi arvense]
MDIHVWRDNWLPTEPPRPLCPRQDTVPPNFYVADFINPRTSHWDYQKLTTFVDSDDIANIMQLRPSVSSANDVLTWAYTNQGGYSVKSGYYIQRQTLNHLLFQCQVTKEIWELATSVIMQTELLTQNTLLQNLNLRITQLQPHHAETLVFFLGWRIWKMRNKLFFEHKRDHITHSIRMAFLDKQQWEDSLHSESPVTENVSSSEATLITDVIGDSSTYYCLVDASWVLSSNRAGIGWSLYSKEGIQLLQSNASIPQTQTFIQAEGIALLMAIQRLQVIAKSYMISLLLTVEDNSSMAHHSLQPPLQFSYKISYLSPLHRLFTLNMFHEIYYMKSISWPRKLDGIVKSTVLRGSCNLYALFY